MSADPRSAHSVVATPSIGSPATAMETAGGPASQKETR
jgi:hypothetical protein